MKGIPRERPHRGPCLRPPKVDGEPRRCRKCETCVTMRQDNWTGQMRAEARFCQRVDMFTLTYGDGNDPYGTVTEDRAKQLFPPDFTGWVKRMRKSNDFRYVVAGEHGTRKGRAHWHVALYWISEPWRIKSDRFLWPPGKGPAGEPVQTEWLHGYIHPKVAVGGREFRYITKYLTDESSTETWFSSSNGIGHEFMVRQWAQLHVDAGIAPRDGRYSFAEDRLLDKTGNPWQYRMHKDVAPKFAKEFVRLWDEQRRGRPYPKSDWLFEQLAKVDKGAPLIGLARKPHDHMRTPTTTDLPPDLRGIASIRWSDPHHCYYVECPTTGRLWWSQSGETGEWRWHGKIGGVRARLEHDSRAAGLIVP